MLLSLPALETVFPPGAGFASGVPTRDARLPGVRRGRVREETRRADVRSLWERVEKESHAETIRRTRERRRNSTLVGHKGVPPGLFLSVNVVDESNCAGASFSFCCAVLMLTALLTS